MFFKEKKKKAEAAKQEIKTARARMQELTAALIEGRPPIPLETIHSGLSSDEIEEELAGLGPDEKRKG